VAGRWWPLTSPTSSALFRQQLTDAGWQYAVAVKGSVSAHDGDAVPLARPYGGLGQPPKAAYPHPPAPLRTLALAHAGQVRPVTWRHGTRTSKDNPDAAMTSWFLAIRVRPAGKPIPRQADRSVPACWLLAEWPPEADEPTGYWLSTVPEDTTIEELVRLAKIRWRARLPRAEDRPRTGPLPGPLLPRMAPPRHPRRPLPGLHHQHPHRPKSACAGMTLYQVMRELQIVLALILGACPLCRQSLTLDQLTATLTPT
jgi:hypothetical protein